VYVGEVVNMVAAIYMRVEEEMEGRIDMRRGKTCPLLMLEAKISSPPDNLVMSTDHTSMPSTMVARVKYEVTPFPICTHRIIHPLNDKESH